jgi:hypothetical protein
MHWLCFTVIKAVSVVCVSLTKSFKLRAQGTSAAS